MKINVVTQRRPGIPILGQSGPLGQQPWCRGARAIQPPAPPRLRKRPQSGTTAVTSISTRARSSMSAATCTAVMAMS